MHALFCFLMNNTGIYPLAADEFEHLHGAVQRLTLNDTSVSVKRENSNALGAGFRCGFLGLLHMDVRNLFKRI